MNRMKGLHIIPDERLKQIPVVDNGEKLVNIADRCPNIVINLNVRSRKGQSLPKKVCYVRESVSSRLSKAQALLPEGYKLMIVEGYRPLRVQRELRNALLEKLRGDHPSWSEDEVKSEADRFVAPIDIIPPHSTGGAVDLTIADSRGQRIDMGTLLYCFNRKSYTVCEGLPEKARDNRRMLMRVMEAAGFVNYPTEWSLVVWR